MEWSIIFFCISAISRALDQLIWLNQQSTSWLPAKVFNWRLWFKTWDALHVYQGITLMGFGLGTYFYSWAAWPWMPLVIYGYYQVFNLFFHVLFRQQWYWQWPFFRFLWKKYRRQRYIY